MQDEHPFSVPLLMGLIIITLGIYGFFWYILLNRKLEKYDEDAPNLTRGVFILFLLPAFWVLITSLISIFFNDNLFFSIIKYIGILLLFSITIKYGSDLLFSFSKVTSRGTGAEFGLFILGFLGFYAVFSGFFSFTPLLILLMFPIILLQIKLNLFLKIRQMKTQRKHYYA